MSTTQPAGGRDDALRLGLLRFARRNTGSSASVSTYVSHFSMEDAQRSARYADVVNNYYDLVTEFYEYGWGDCFHLAPRFAGETLRTALLRHEHWLALQLRLSPAMRVLDIGCGVGGPMRNMARLTGCRVTGVNLNAHQVGRAEALNRKAGLDDLCALLHTDFMSLPLPPASVDAAYAIEATVHAPSLEGVYAEIRRVLKPGGLFATYEWCLLPGFDPADPEHRRLKRNMEIGNGLVDMPTSAEVERAMRASGFEIVAMEDRCAGAAIPWYEPFVPHYNPLKLRKSAGLGLALTNAGVSVLEALRIAPRGTSKVAYLLGDCSRTLLEIGRSGIFTPGLFVLARNPGMLAIESVHGAPDRLPL